MGSHRRPPNFGFLSRRDFVRWCGLPLAVRMTTRLGADALPRSPQKGPPGVRPEVCAYYRLSPHYRTQSPLDEILGQTHPGHDGYISEVYAEEVASALARWSAALCQIPVSLDPIVEVLSPALAANSIRPQEETCLRNKTGMQIWRGLFSAKSALQRESFVQELAAFFESTWRLRTAEFEVASISIKQESPLLFATRIRYDLVGSKSKGDSDERTGCWDLEWGRETSGALAIRAWRPVQETHSRVTGRVFEDITPWALGGNASYTQQMLRGADYWRTVLDVACGIDVYGNNGVACGDIDNDGFDEIYVCQSAGLPNRLYRNRGDIRFEDITETAGVGVLDDTSGAVFVDVDNDGSQDLIVVRTSGPLLFQNLGNGTFQHRPDAFRFDKPPQGTFTGVALADYDRDGWLDIYFCLYSYYEGTSQYRYPTPYYDAQNGPPKFLLRNNRDGTFGDVTAEAGLLQNDNRFTFDCGWCDYNNDGWPDLYVVNDFGRKNLYRNNGNGTFTDVAEEAGVPDVGPGMSCSWFDYDNDGNQDLYVCDMWEPAGTRVSMQEAFMKSAPENVRALYRRHAKGNSLYHNQGNGEFAERSAEAGVEKAGWSWSCAAWDFDHDGHADLYVANGMISGPLRYDLQSFFWRQVVSQSPLGANPSPSYEEGWNAINELIRSDGTWNGYQRNVFFVNSGNGTFAHASGVAGLDFNDDSRAFALADLDHDGSLEIVLKNRTGPQVRILRNVMDGRGDSICFRLRGRQSNRDAIGTIISLESAGGRQVKFLQAGSGFFSQHTKELFFGLGEHRGTVRASVCWPSGLVQQFEGLPSNHRIELQEGSSEFHAEPFAPAKPIPKSVLVEQKSETPPAECETWLLDPLPAPEFALRDLEGRPFTLSAFRGRHVLLHFWNTMSPHCPADLKRFQGRYSDWLGRGLQLLAVNANAPSETETVRDFATRKELMFPVLLASEDMLGTYNLLYRYLFDRRRNLGIPTSFLIDDTGQIVKIYQGPLNTARPEEDVRRIPQDQAEREGRALPFPGKFYGGEFHRNLFTYGVAFFRAGYFDEAISWFQRVVRKYPEYQAAYYSLGTLYLKKGMLQQAEENLRRAIALRPGDATAWNNLGMVAAQEGRGEEAIKYFQEAVRQNPNHIIALENLGKLYHDSGRFDDAVKSLQDALRVDPLNPEVNYDLGMLFARQGDAERARVYLQKALQLRPDYPDALNNLGVLNIRTGKFSDAEAVLEECIRVAPAFDMAYLNLAKAYVAMGKPERARGVLRQLLEVNPGHQAARQALQELGH
ncbi:MAG TPA: FG-GAP-like repeat-containing protein [Terriglobia bacterium]|nr:FG-GAP-like repeat-containing protein [Terriglobia bacterium]